jgi:DNA replication and repair protein RecF
MSLAELRIENLRCIESAALEFSPELNLIAGENGAGKTSILEAIFLLGRGRSFRTRNSERLIRHGQPKLTVFGRTDDAPPKVAGIEIAADGGTRARINGENARSLLELSGVVPVQAIDPEIHKLVDQGPNAGAVARLVGVPRGTNLRRHWARYNRALKQRNAAWEAGGGDRAWDEELVAQGMPITERASGARDGWCRGFEQTFRALRRLESSGFSTGWARNDLRRRSGATLSATGSRVHHRGPHRADVTLRRDHRVARETLSRGQQKLTAVAMIVSQLQLLQDELGLRACCFWTIPRPSWTKKSAAFVR